MTAAWDRSGAGQRLQTAVISCENTVLLYGSETNFLGGSKFLVEMLYFSEVRFFHAYITKNGNSTCCALVGSKKLKYGPVQKGTTRRSFASTARSAESDEI